MDLWEKARKKTRKEEPQYQREKSQSCRTESSLYGRGTRSEAKEATMVTLQNIYGGLDALPRL